MDPLESVADGVVERLRAPASIDFHELVALVARHRGRPLEVRIQDDKVLHRRSCGWWAERDAGDLILIPHGLSEYHRRFCVMHELAHGLATPVATEPSNHVMAQHFQHLDPEVVRRMLARDLLEPTEVLAEMVADRMNALLRRRNPVPQFGRVVSWSR